MIVRLKEFNDKAKFILIAISLISCENLMQKPGDYLPESKSNFALIPSGNQIDIKQKMVNNPAKLPDTPKSETAIEVRHVSLRLQSSFVVFTDNLERYLGRFDPSVLKAFNKNPAVLKKKLEEMQGEQNLMLFGIEDQGSLLILYGKAGKAKQYLIGNPLIAASMTAHDIRAGLYAPLRILVYEDYDKKIYVEYDLPSTLFGQFNNPQVTTVAQNLDVKLHNLIVKSDNYHQ